jgi:hypothetical protein
MPRQRIPGLGTVGLNTDIHPSLLPPETWTRFYNVQTQDGSVRSAIGERKLFDLDIKPLYHTAFVDNGVPRIIVSDGARVYAYEVADGTSEDITPGVLDWTAGRVTFTDLNGVLVVNSVSDGPFYWAGTGTALVALPGWDANWRCKEMVAYRYHLVALNMYETVGLVTSHYPHKLKWSNSAEEGAIPTLWVAALSNDAGDDLLGETPGEIVTAVLLRDFLAVVKEDAIYSMTWIGGVYVMQTQRLKGGVGTRNAEGVAEVRNQVVTFTTSDLLAFDGQNAISLVDKKVRRGLANAISPDYWAKSVVFAHPQSSTLYVAGVAPGSDRLTNALAFNWEEGTWSERQLTYGYGFDSTLVNIAVAIPVWDDLDTTPYWLPGPTWDELLDGPWNKGVYNPSVPDVVVYESNLADDAWWVSILALTNTNSDGTPKTCTAERTGIPLEGADGMAMITEVWPEIAGTIPVRFWVGGQLVDESSPSWDGPYTVTPGQTTSFCPRVTGRFIAIRVESYADGWWSLASLTIHHERAGER